MDRLRLTTIDPLSAGDFRVRLRTNGGRFFTVIVSEAILRDQDQFAAVLLQQTGYGLRLPRDGLWQMLIAQRLESSTRRADPIGYFQAHWHERESPGR